MPAVNPAASAQQTAPGEPIPVISKAKLQWEPLDSSDYALLRAKVPGGWLVALAGASVTFYPDPEHQWAARPWLDPYLSLMYGQQENSADNGHFESTCYIAPALVV